MRRHPYRELLRQALDEADRQIAPTVFAGVALLMLAGAAFDALLMPPGSRWLIVALDVATSGVSSGLRAMWRRAPVRGWRADIVWVAFGALIGANQLATMSVTRDAAYVAFAILVLASAGVVVRSLAALGALALAITVPAVMLASSFVSPQAMAPFIFGLVAASVTGAFLFAARRQACARVAVLRRRDELRRERLRLALERAQSTLAEREKADAEKERLRVALLEAQKMEAVGRLSGAVAHDINNVLTAILSAADMLLLDANLDAAARDDVMAILDSARRGAAFTKNLLAVGRQGKYASEPLDPGDLVRDAERALAQALPIEVQLVTELHHGDCSIEGDQGQLTQALVNVCTNAVEAMRDGGKLTVRTDRVTLNDAEAAQRAVAPGDYVRFSITDSGDGMDSEDRQRAFEPFYTKKPEHLGAGLGLAMAYGAARNHGGSAEIQSKLGRGTTVTLHLPCASVETRLARPTSSAPAGERRTDLRGCTVLLVDDEASVRAVARRILERMEVRVTEAENGRRALVALASEGPFDLVVADLAMPIMGGAELLARLRETSPTQRVLLVTGFGNGREATDFVAAGAVGVVEKPYTSGGLARAVHAALRPARSKPPRAESA